MLSTSQKKRLKLKAKKAAAKEPAPPARVPIAAPEDWSVDAGKLAADDGNADDPAVAHRQALLAKLRAAREAARNASSKPGFRSADAAASAAVSAAKGLVKQYKDGNLSESQMKRLADLEEKFYGECGGNVEMFCHKNNIDPRAIPAISDTLKGIQEGKSLAEALPEAARALASVIH